MEHDKTYQLHNVPQCALDANAVIPINSDDTGNRANKRKVDEGPIVTHRLLQIVKPFSQEPVKLARQQYGIARKEIFALDF